MSAHLNPSNDLFFMYYNSKIFVDKSLLIDVTNNGLNKEDNKYICITRPRRFGKTLAISMLSAYYSKGCDSKEFFDKLAISKSPSYLEHLNKHNVILVDMGGFYAEAQENFLNELTEQLIHELDEAFPNILTKNEDTIGKAIRKINLRTGERFIFLIDEWDVIFRELPSTEVCRDYILLLRSLFKASDTSSCIDLVYMTGIFPIVKYGSQSELNIFDESSMIDPLRFSNYVGFTEDEVKDLCAKHNADFEMIKQWYDGYHLGNFKIYNPLDINETIELNKCDRYWAATGSIEALTNYMNYDNGVLKEKIVKLLANEKIPVITRRFRNDLSKVDSEDAALTILIHLGYLAYDEENETCYIPNYEIKQVFISAVNKLKWNI